MFQCPTSGFFLFYKAKFASEAEKMRFNALLRASSFSTEFKIKKKDKYVLFQCPTSGFFLFYMDNKLHLESTDGLFQCPTSGFFLFYDNHDKKWQAENDVSMPYFGLLSFLLLYVKNKQMEHAKSFNALLRASFFSTLCLCTH